MMKILIWMVLFKNKIEQIYILIKLFHKKDFKNEKQLQKSLN